MRKKTARRPNLKTDRIVVAGGLAVPYPRIFNSPDYTTTKRSKKLKDENHLWFEQRSGSQKEPNGFAVMPVVMVGTIDEILEHIRYRLTECAKLALDYPAAEQNHATWVAHEKLQRILRQPKYDDCIVAPAKPRKSK